MSRAVATAKPEFANWKAEFFVKDIRSLIYPINFTDIPVPVRKGGDICVIVTTIVELDSPGISRGRRVDLIHKRINARIEDLKILDSHMQQAKWSQPSEELIIIFQTKTSATLFNPRQIDRQKNLVIAWYNTGQPFRELTSFLPSAELVKVCGNQHGKKYPNT